MKVTMFLRKACPRWARRGREGRRGAKGHVHMHNCVFKKHSENKKSAARIRAADRLQMAVSPAGKTCKRLCARGSIPVHKLADSLAAGNVGQLLPGEEAEVYGHNAVGEDPYRYSGQGG